MSTDTVDPEKRAKVIEFSTQLAKSLATPEPPAPPPTPEPGLYPGVSFDEYFRWPYANNSLLQHFARSAAHARVEMLSPAAPTKALDFGHKFHLAVLEPDRFEAETVLSLDLPRRKNADKEEHAKFERENAGKYILSPGELAQIRSMQQAVRSHPVAGALLQAKGLNEVALVWDHKNGARCKARTDALREYTGFPFALDLKTTEDASPQPFSRSIHKYGYHQQGAFYVDGLAALGEDGVRFVIIAVEKDPPFGVALYELDDASMDLGRSEYRQHLREYAKSIATGEWPGYPTELGMNGVPHYALKQFAEGD